MRDGSCLNLGVPSNHVQSLYLSTVMINGVGSRASVFIELTSCMSPSIAHPIIVPLKRYKWYYISISRVVPPLAHLEGYL